MIKLNRPNKPSKLTPKVEKQLIDEYKKTEKPVWKKDFITVPLLKMSHNKCCYCETILGVQARPMQVEHYHCKSLYPDEVVKWENLLPSCSDCNSNKSTIDTYKTPLIDPSVDDPREYLYLKFFMIRSKDNSILSKGRMTVDKLDLNNQNKLVIPRIKIAIAMRDKLKDIYKKAVDLNLRKDGKLYNKSKIINTLVDILTMAQPDAEYSAFVATIILTDDDYIETMKILKSKNLWTNELESLHINADKIKLDSQK